MTTLLRTARFLAAAAFYVVLFAAALEACARVDDFLSYGAPPADNHYTLERLKIVDEDGIRGRPGARFEKWQMNRQGFRGADAAPEAGSLRVLVLGASETFGLYESPGKEYPAQLRELLAARLGRPVEVMNAGLPGMSLPRAVQFCERRLERLRPDLVLYYPTPAGYLDEEPPALPRADREPRRERPMPRLARRLPGALKTLLPEAAQDALRRRELARAARGKPEGWLFREAPEERVALFERDLRALARAVKAAGVPLVLATHAHRFREPLTEPEARHLRAWRRFYPRAEETVILRMEARANAAIRLVAAEEGAALADLAAAVPPEPANFHDFAHFTDQGARLAAEAFAGTVAIPPAVGYGGTGFHPEESR
jgi:lysophospholipase L1-like esterase